MIKRVLTFVWIAVFIAPLAAQTQAAQAQNEVSASVIPPLVVQDEVPASVIERFKVMYPKTVFKEIRKSEIPGLYEVVMGNTVAYSDEAGRYFIFGHLFDMRNHFDLTAQRKLEARRKLGIDKEFPTIYLDQAIKTVKGNGSRVVAIFSDPDCPYSKQLEHALVRLNNVTIYTFLYPLISLHPQAKDKAVSVWCAPNRAKAWSDLMLANKQPKSSSCHNPIIDNWMAGTTLDISGTPTLIAADGRALLGSKSTEEIDQWLNASKPTASEKKQEVVQ